MSLSFAESATDSRPLILVSEADAATVIAGRTPAEREWIAAAGFKGTLGQLCVLPAVDGRPAAALFGTGTEGWQTAITLVPGPSVWRISVT